MGKRSSQGAPRQTAGTGKGKGRGTRSALRPAHEPTKDDTAGDESLAAETPVRTSVPPGGRERAVLVAVVTGKAARNVVESHLDELAQLVDTAGGVAVARLLQERKSPDPTTFIGKGR